MVKSELVKLKGMEIYEQEFDGDTLMTVKMKDTGKIYVGVKWVTEALGFSIGQHQRQVTNIRKDIVLQNGIADLQLPTKGGNQKSLCIELDFLPLWLAKISITPNMKNENPNIVDKLIDYQLKAKDVLAEAFLGKSKEWNLQREVGKVDRKRLTSSINKNIPNAQSWDYANYTNMIYEVLFNKTAAQLREERELDKKSQLTRDHFSKEELALIDEAETIVTALVSLGFKKDYILDQLRRKYQKEIEMN